MLDAGRKRGDSAARMRWALRAMLGVVLPLLSAACDKAPEFYYLMEMDALVDGEPVAFRVKVGCRTFRVSDGELFPKARMKLAERQSFGYRLSSGQGFFVAAPHNCGLVNDREMFTVPLIYITDSYDHPTHLRIFTSPYGPSANTGVQLRRSVIRILSLGEEEDVPVLVPDDHDPFFKPKGKPRPPSWDTFALLAAKPGTVIPPDMTRTAVSPDGRWEIFIAPRQPPPEFRPDISAQSYWDHFRASFPLSRAVGIGESEGAHYKNARHVYRYNIRLLFKDGMLVGDPSMNGVIDAYPHGLFPWRQQSVHFRIGDAEAIITVPRQVQDALVYVMDKQTGQIYAVDSSMFHP